MPGRQVWTPTGTVATTSTPVDVIERASPDIFTVSTADPTTGTTLAVAARDRFPQAANFKIRVENEVMLVTAGFGTGAGSFTVTRGQDGTTNVAHVSGVTVSMLVGVQRVEPVDGGRQVSFKGRAGAFRTPGRASTTGQKIFAIHNATGSAVLVDVHNIQVDLVSTVVKAVTVLPPAIRVYKFTAVPTNGTALTKNGEDSALTSKSTVTVWGDASADGTSSATTLTIAAITNGSQTGMMDQIFASRFMGGAGTNPQSELFDLMRFFPSDDEIMTLRALEGLAIHLDTTLATQAPTTDMLTVSCRWIEYTAS